MEETLIVTMVFASIGLLLWSFIRAFKGEDGCSSCGVSGECRKDKNYPSEGG